MKDFGNTSITAMAVIVAEHLKQQNIEVVLVGGLAVEIYTENLYLTKDIDLVNTNYQKPRLLSQSMAELGFRKQGRVYINETTDITIEFPPGPLAVGHNLIKDTTVAHVSHGSIPILYAKDVIKDRLAAFMHWQDKQSLIQALAIVLKHALNIAAFRGFCEQEGSVYTYQLFERLYHCALDEGIHTMEQLEALLTQIMLNEI